MIDACCTHSYVVDSVVIESNATKFRNNVEKLLPISVLKSELQYYNPFRNASAPSEGGSANYGRVAAKMHTTLVISGVTR